MADPALGTLLLLSDFALAQSQPAQTQLQQILAQRLRQPVVLCDFGQSGRTPAAGIIELIQTDVQRIVVLTCGMLGATDRIRLNRAVQIASQQSPLLQFRIAPVLTWIEIAAWLQATVEQSLANAGLAAEDACLLLLGRGSEQQLINADVARLAQLLRESLNFRRVEHAYQAVVRPNFTDAWQTLARADPQQLVVLPWWTEGDALAAFNTPYMSPTIDCPLPILDVRPTLAHANIVNSLIANYQSASAGAASFLARTGDMLNSDQVVAMQTGVAAGTASAQDLVDRDGLDDLQRRINLLLPRQYQGTYAKVQPKSMGSAKLKLDEAGRVAWDQIWTSFCDLALAGGPPHRGQLLEAVTAEQADAAPERYREVVAEIERGIRMVTALPVVTSRVLGWVGIRCHSEEMAAWLMRAIIVENVMVRREGDTLYLPAGPDFTVPREIKNVITTIAKTVHYWTAHLRERGST